MDCFSMEHNGQLSCMCANGHINWLQNGGGLFSKPMFSTHLELRRTYVGRLENWNAAAFSGEVESFIKPERQQFKRPTSACILQHRVAERLLAGKKAGFALLQHAEIFCKIYSQLLCTFVKYST